MADPESELIPLHLHTLDTLCDELVSGRPIPIEGAMPFQLDSKEARSIFNWYLRNRNIWAGNSKAEDAKKMAEQLKYPPPTKPTKCHTQTENQKRCLHLKKVTVHRFGGIHRYETVRQAPNDFEYEFNRQITLIEGKNGSGKTSFLNAIVWCLTGHIYRSQRSPETIDAGIDIFLEESDNEQDELQKTVTAITPIPDENVFRALGDNCVPLDTSVELSFVDDEGVDAGTIKRSLKRTPRGKIEIEEPDFSTFRLDPIAWEVGTRMAGLIPYIQLGIKSDIGEALTTLTGIRPLEALVRHANKSKQKLDGPLSKERRDDNVRLISEFANGCRGLQELIASTPSITCPSSLSRLKLDSKANNRLRELKDYFDNLESDALKDCQRILGEEFDHKNASNKKDLLENIGKALGLLEFSNLGRLPSSIRLNDLKQLSDKDISEAETLIEEIVTQSVEIEELSQKPNHAARHRLYARIATWIKDHKHEKHICPICLQDLTQKVDDVTGKKITEHIDEHLLEDKEYLANTIRRWGDVCERLLLSKLHNTFTTEMSKGLPNKPADLIYSAFGNELFDTKIFSGTLSPLKATTQQSLKDQIINLPDYIDAKPPCLSKYISDNCTGLCAKIEKVTRVISFAKWRKKHNKECRDLFVSIIGIKQDIATG